MLTAMNTRELQIENEEPHPCSIDRLTITMFNDDYESIINCCQRHVFRSDGYCKSETKKGCRFGYPIFDIKNETTIDFEESNDKVQAKINLKRNDEFMNTHNRIMALSWRGNMDMQMMIKR